MNRRSFLKLLAALPLAAQAPRLFAADETAGREGSRERVIWGPPVIPTTILGVAARQGEFRKNHPFKVQVWKNPDQLRAGFANHSIAMTIVPSYVAANLAAQGQDVKLVNIMTFGLLQVVGRGPKLSGIGDLAGKKIVIPFKNDMPDLMLQVVAAKAGVDFASLNATYVSQPPEALMMLIKGQVDYALVPEPLATMATLKGKQMGQDIGRLLDLQDEWRKVLKTESRSTQAGLMVTGKIMREHPETVLALQKDLESAARWTLENPREAAEIGANYLPVPANALELAIPHSHLGAEPADGIAEEILFFYKQLYDLNPKIVGGKMPDESLFAELGASAKPLEKAS